MCNQFRSVFSRRNKGYSFNDNDRYVKRVEVTRLKFSTKEDKGYLWIRRKAGATPGILMHFTSGIEQYKNLTNSGIVCSSFSLIDSKFWP
jgi:hypothetical protein